MVHLGCRTCLAATIAKIRNTLWQMSHRCRPPDLLMLSTWPVDLLHWLKLTQTRSGFKLSNIGAVDSQASELGLVWLWHWLPVSLGCEYRKFRTKPQGTACIFNCSASCYATVIWEFRFGAVPQFNSAQGTATYNEQIFMELPNMRRTHLSWVSSMPVASSLRSTSGVHFLKHTRTTRVRQPQLSTFLINAAWNQLNYLANSHLPFGGGIK